MNSSSSANQLLLLTGRPSSRTKLTIQANQQNQTKPRSPSSFSKPCLIPSPISSIQMRTRLASRKNPLFVLPLIYCLASLFQYTRQQAFSKTNTNNNACPGTVKTQVHQMLGYSIIITTCSNKPEPALGMTWNSSATPFQITSTEINIEPWSSSQIDATQYLCVGHKDLHYFISSGITASTTKIKLLLGNQNDKFQSTTIRGTSLIVQSQREHEVVDTTIAANSMPAVYRDDPHGGDILAIRSFQATIHILTGGGGDKKASVWDRTNALLTPVSSTASQPDDVFSLDQKATDFIVGSKENLVIMASKASGTLVRSFNAIGTEIFGLIYVSFSGHFVTRPSKDNFKITLFIDSSTTQVAQHTGDINIAMTMNAFTQPSTAPTQIEFFQGSKKDETDSIQFWAISGVSSYNNCAPGCVICSGNLASQCLVCSPGKWINPHFSFGTCSSTCNWACSQCRGPTDNDCVPGECQFGYTQVGITSTCASICATSQYWDGAACQSCDASCGGPCSGAGFQNCGPKATSCAATYGLVGTECRKTCSANQFYRASDNSCQPCHASCATCEIGTSLAGECKTCPSNYHFTMVSSPKGTCTVCDASCGGQCSGSGYQNCGPATTTCAATYGLVGTECRKTCAGNEYFRASDNTCQACHPSCLTCDVGSGQANECKTCDSGKYFTMVSSPKGTCTVCDSACGGTCSGSGYQNCGPATTTCAATYGLVGTECRKTCAANEVFDASNNSCQVCHSSCLTCIQGTSLANECKTCASGKYFTMISTPQGTCTSCDSACGGTCSGSGYQNCGPSASSCAATYGLVGTECRKICAANEYFRASDNTCQPCHSSCLTCEVGTGQANECKTCASGKYFTMVSSPKGTCTVCNSSCGSQCSGPGYQNCGPAATACAATYGLFGTECRKACTSSQYFQASDNTCQPCHSSCLTCDVGSGLANECKSCQAGQYLNIISQSKGNCESCDSSCGGTCSGGTYLTCGPSATSCDTGFTLIGNECRRTCTSSQYFKALDNSCQACHSSCSTCEIGTGLANECLTCPQDKTRNQIYNKTCIQLIELNLGYMVFISNTTEIKLNETQTQPSENQHTQDKIQFNLQEKSADKIRNFDFEAVQAFLILKTQNSTQIQNNLKLEMQNIQYQTFYDYNLTKNNKFEPNSTDVQLKNLTYFEVNFDFTKKTSWTDELNLNYSQYIIDSTHNVHLNLTLTPDLKLKIQKKAEETVNEFNISPAAVATVKGASSTATDYAPLIISLMPALQVVTKNLNKILIFSLIPVTATKELISFYDLFSNWNSESFLRKALQKNGWNLRYWDQINFYIPSSYFYQLDTSSIVKIINYCLIILSIYLFKNGKLQKWYIDIQNKKSKFKKFTMTLIFKALFLFLPFGDYLFNFQNTILKVFIPIKRLHVGPLDKSVYIETLFLTIEIIVIVLINIKCYKYFQKYNYLLDEEEGKVSDDKLFQQQLVINFDKIFSSKGKISYIQLVSLTCTLNTLIILACQYYPNVCLSLLLVVQIGMVVFMFKNFQASKRNLIVFIVFLDYFLQFLIIIGQKLIHWRYFQSTSSWIVIGCTIGQIFISFVLLISILIVKPKRNFKNKIKIRPFNLHLRNSELNRVYSKEVLHSERADPQGSNRPEEAKQRNKIHDSRKPVIINKIKPGSPINKSSNGLNKKIRRSQLSRQFQQSKQGILLKPKFNRIPLTNQVAGTGHNIKDIESISEDQKSHINSEKSRINFLNYEETNPKRNSHELESLDNQTRNQPRKSRFLPYQQQNDRKNDDVWGSQSFKQLEDQQIEELKKVIDPSNQTPRRLSLKKALAKNNLSLDIEIQLKRMQKEKLRLREKQNQTIDLKPQINSRNNRMSQLLQSATNYQSENKIRISNHFRKRVQPVEGIVIDLNSSNNQSSRLKQENGFSSFKHSSNKNDSMQNQTHGNKESFRSEFMEHNSLYGSQRQMLKNNFKFEKMRIRVKRAPVANQVKEDESY